VPAGVHFTLFALTSGAYNASTMIVSLASTWRRCALLACALALVAFPAAAVECVGPPVEHVVAPAATDPAIGLPNTNHYAYLTPGVARRGQLVVFFPGSCGPPIVYRTFLREAANHGFHAIGLSHPNCPVINIACSQQDPIDPDCQEKMRLERLEGIDASPLAEVEPANAIVNRLVKLLAHLHAQFPSEGWDAYLDGGAPRWPQIVVAGHSQGAGHAALVGLRHEVARVVMFDWGDIVPGVGAAPWMSKPKATPIERFYSLYHEKNFAGIVVLGMNAMGMPDDVVRVPDTAEPYAHAHRLLTAVEDEAGEGTAGAHHSAVVLDGITPVRDDGTPELADVWRYLLGATPAEVVPVPAAKLLLKDGTAKAKPNAKKLQLGISTRGAPAGQRVVQPALGSDGDPTLHGAVLHVFNAAAGGEVASFALPAAGWQRLGSTSKPRGFRFRGDGAIRKVMVEHDRVTITGGKASFCYSLDEAQQGRVGARLELGSAVAWCVDVPAKAQGNPPSTAKNDAVDVFRGAANTPAPATCPLVPRAPAP